MTIIELLVWMLLVLVVSLGVAMLFGAVAHNQRLDDDD